MLYTKSIWGCYNKFISDEHTKVTRKLKAKFRSDPEPVPRTILFPQDPPNKSEKTKTKRTQNTQVHKTKTFNSTTDRTDHPDKKKTHIIF